jgi:rfaE bifunctional protein kinase chain/domain
MDVHAILRDIRAIKVLVVGDVCLDRWCYYDPDLTEPSRETGIPRLAVVRTDVTPGAAGTIANNLVSLGVRDVSVLGAFGDDGFGWELLRSLRERGIATDLLVRSVDVPTFTYTKLINQRTGIEDQSRVDFIPAGGLSVQAEAEVLAKLKSSFDRFDVVLVCDQAETQQEGVVTKGVRDLVGELAAASPDRVVWVDSRVRLELFRNVIAKPNAGEAELACLRAFRAVDLPRLYETCGFRLLVVTQGADGVRVMGPDGLDRSVPGRKVTPVDICGAGDSFSAGAACALAVTRDPIAAAEFGNLIASITVQKTGTGTASPDEVLSAAQDLR